jgi:hypothetical protein
MNTHPSDLGHNDEDALSLFETGSMDIHTDPQMIDLALACQEAREKMKYTTLPHDMAQRDSSYLLTAMTR